MTFRSVFVVAASFWLSGCATYSYRAAQARTDFYSGRYEVAEAQLKEHADKEGNDQMLYLMDLGTVYYSEGKYKEAIETFLKADKIADTTDYTSITSEAAAVLLNDEIKEYKGEDFEKILINVYLALAYTMTNQWEEALVECRKVNHKLDLMISKGKKPYQYNAFAKYLAAALFEAQGEINNAWVDYRQLLKWGSANDFPYLPGPLLRTTERLQAAQELEMFKAKFPGVSNYRLKKNEGEIVLIVEQGRAPVKQPSPAFRLAPVFVKSPYSTKQAVIHDDQGKFSAPSETLFDIESTAMKELESQLAGIIAKKAAGIAAKEAAAYGVAKATDSKLAGALTSLFLHATDTADLRSWTTLPARLQIARLTVPAGKHNLVLDLVSYSGGQSKAVKRWDGVEVRPGQTRFLSYRAVEN